MNKPLTKQPLDRLAWLLLGLTALFILLYPFSLRNGSIETDEAWLGQQVQALANTGAVSSDLFRDVPPLDGPIVVYHKLLIWAGAGISWLGGFGIIQLRLISTCAGLLTALLLLFGRIDHDSRRIRWLAVAILLFTPLFDSYLRMFRPEMPMAALGFGSFLLLCRTDKGTLPSSAGAGALAGLAGLTHAFGLAFVVAGIVFLLIMRRWRDTVCFAVAAVLVFSPYISGWFTDHELFQRQLFTNAFTDARLSLEWWQPINNLLHEHTRLFRKPEVIGLSVATLLALLLLTRQQWRRDRHFLIYTATLLALGGMAPLPKITRYMLPLTPFFALIVARAWHDAARAEGYRRVVRHVLSGWLVLFFAYGIHTLGVAAFGATTRQTDTNRALAAEIEPGAVVMAPFDFVFHGPSPLVVQSWWGCEKTAHELPTVPFVEQYALGVDVRYIILDSLRMEKLRLTPEQIPAAFRSYQPLLLLPDQQRFLLGRRP